MKALRTFLAIGVVVAALEWSYAGSAETNMPPVRSSIPYVATRSDAVQDMLWMANVGKNDVVYDLGSGDGHIVTAAVRDFGARRAVGIEIDPNRIRESRENAKKAGVTDRVKFIQGDLFTTDFRQASVVTLFLGHRTNIKLRSRIFRTLKPGTRIVSHQFGMGEWKPDKILTIREALPGMFGEMGNPFKDNPHVPDYDVHERHFGTGDKVMIWVVPAPVAGVWRGKIKTSQGLQDCQLILHQRLSRGSGTFRLSGETDLEGGVNFDVCGDRVRYECVPKNMNRYQRRMKFDGHIHGDVMEGALSVFEQGRMQPRKGTWKVQREPADYTGTWEWTCATGPRSVRLRIEQRDGNLKATYLDGDKEIPITDFYDWGGGFYFTLLIGREGNSIRITEGTGWLIGEAVADNGALKGTIEFYPWKQKIPVLEGGKITGETEVNRAMKVILDRDWAPHLIKP